MVDNIILSVKESADKAVRLPYDIFSTLRVEYLCCKYGNGENNQEDVINPCNESPYNNGGKFVHEENGELVYHMLHTDLDESDPLYTRAKLSDMTMLAMIRDEKIGPNYVNCNEYTEWVLVKELIESRQNPSQNQETKEDITANISEESNMKRESPCEPKDTEKQEIKEDNAEKEFPSEQKVADINKKLSEINKQADFEMMSLIKEMRYQLDILCKALKGKMTVQDYVSMCQSMEKVHKKEKLFEKIQDSLEEI